MACAATPSIVPAGAMVLQPSDERRRSGSHYTPRSLTEPIVATTFRPILERLGPNPTPEQILDLKVCDPAMGSGAFLVAVCRFLAELLVRAWHAHNARAEASRPTRTRSSTPAASWPSAASTAWTRTRWRSTWPSCRSGWRRWRRTTRSRSWTMPCSAAIRWSGSRKAQILGFHWKPEKQRDFARAAIEGQLSRALEQRRQIREAPDGTSEASLQRAAAGRRRVPRPGPPVRRPRRLRLLRGRQRSEAEGAARDAVGRPRRPAQPVRRGTPSAARGGRRRSFAADHHPVVPFHWEIEFPEVFDRENPGFDAFVGNPPFVGKNTHLDGHAARLSRLAQDDSTRNRTATPTSSPISSVARFDLLRSGGTLRPDRHQHDRPGRHADHGLRWICTHGGTIYAATRRKKWPGQAAVIVSVVHVAKGTLRWTVSCSTVDRCRIITAYLFHAGGHDDPAATQGQRRQESPWAACLRAWASPSTTPIPKASPHRSQ